MKRNILVLMLAFGFTFANAQSIEFRVDSLGSSVNGQFFTVGGLPNPPGGELIKHLWVIQNSGSQMDIGAKVYELSAGPNGSAHTVCWFVCYAPITTPFTAPDILTVEDDTVRSNFSAHYYPSGSVGCGTYRYVLYDNNNPTDSAYVDIRFCTDGTPTSINDFSENNVEFKTYPNPASDNLTINYSIDGNPADARVDVFDVLGQRINTYKLSNNEGRLGIDVSALNSGVYFYTIKVNGQAVKTERVMVR